MNRLRSAALALAATATLAGLLAEPLGASPPRQPGTTTPPPEDTPIVDPDPEPEPLFLPLVLARADKTEPPPLLPEVQGYVAVLTRAGREACAPATHAVLARPEGTPGNTAVAVAYASPDEPDMNLDLYVTDFVVAGGIEDLAPPECRIVSTRLLEVRRIRVVPLPPGGTPRYSSVGKRTSTAIE